jgi:hypothetical protein
MSLRRRGCGDPVLHELAQFLGNEVDLQVAALQGNKKQTTNDVNIFRFRQMMASLLPALAFLLARCSEGAFVLAFVLGFGGGGGLAPLCPGGGRIPPPVELIEVFDRLSAMLAT